MQPSNLLTVLLLCLVSLGLAVQQANPLGMAKYEGKLKVAMRNTPAVFYQHQGSYAGFEYELVEEFAKQLGVELEVQAYASARQMEEAVLHGKAHMAAGSLALTSARQTRFNASQAVQTAKQFIVYRSGHFRPKSWQDITSSSSLAVLNSSAEAEALQHFQQEFNHLSWLETEQLAASDLLKLVQDGELDYALVNSQDFNINRFYFSRISEAFSADTSNLVWLFANTANTSLVEAANNFLTQAAEDGFLTQVRDKYYSHEDQLDFVGAPLFLRRIKTTLPYYQDYFLQAEEATGIDWHLLAALSFQESHWLPLAKSPTGVRGIMMLTRITAKELQVNRLNAKESIEGGARYLKSLISRIPKQVEGEDRILMAMAAYNVGLGHLEDARKITQARGFNPNKWVDVAKHLPLLSQRKWYKNTRFGYARGYEAVSYVENIRRYQQILLWHELTPADLVLEAEKKAANLEIETAFKKVPAL